MYISFYLKFNFQFFFDFGENRGFSSLNGLLEKIGKHSSMLLNAIFSGIENNLRCDQKQS